MEELKVALVEMSGKKPRCSGFFKRTLNTQYGHIPDLKVPKLRHSNGQRQWKILERYQRALGNFLNWICCLYVMGLSLRDLQEAFAFIQRQIFYLPTFTVALFFCQPTI